MGKKATLGTVIGMVIFLIVLGITFKACSDIFGAKTSIDSYYKILETMQELSQMEPGSSKTATFTFSKDSAFFGFYNNSPEIRVKWEKKEYTEGTYKCRGPLTGFEGFIIKRPVGQGKCPKVGKGGCICLCDDEEFDMEANHLCWEKGWVEVTCGTLACTSVQKLGYKRMLKSGNIFHRTFLCRKTGSCTDFMYKTINTGGWFINHWGYNKKVASLIFYLQDDEEVLVCDKAPCPPEQGQPLLGT